MCGEPIGNAFPPASAPAPQPIPKEPPAYQPPAQPPAPYQPPAYQPPAPAPYQPPAYQPPTPAPAPSQQDYSPQPISAPIPASIPPPVPTPYAAPLSRPTLKLIHPTGREFYLPSEGGFMGRHSPSNPATPEIDLAGIPDEGVVSRMHARFYWDAGQNAYMITDNSSRNGTSLNGMPLKPGIGYRVDQGMSLQLGQDNLVSFRIAVG